MNIGERLREERERLGFSQLALADIAGVKRNAQGNYEKGERLPDAAYLAAIAGVGVDVKYVVTGVRDMADMSALEQVMLTAFRGASLDIKGAALNVLLANKAPAAITAFMQNYGEVGGVFQGDNNGGIHMGGGKGRKK